MSTTIAGNTAYTIVRVSNTDDIGGDVAILKIV